MMLLRRPEMRVLDRDSKACRRMPGGHDGGGPVGLVLVGVPPQRRVDGQRVLLGVKTGDLVTRQQQSARPPKPSRSVSLSSGVIEALRSPSRNRCCICAGSCSASGAGDAVRLSRAILLWSSGLGIRQKLRACSSSSNCTSRVLQMPVVGFCQGTPRPLVSRLFGVIRADWDKSEIDRRLDCRFRGCPSTLAGLQPAEQPRAPEGIMSPGDTSASVDSSLDPAAEPEAGARSDE